MKLLKIVSILLMMMLLSILLSACSGAAINAWWNGVAYNPKAVNPSLAQVQYFLSIDGTCDQMYSSSFTCVNFAHMLQQHAEDIEGLRCAVVILSGVGEGHEMDAFQTTDDGLIYVEPQEDSIVSNFEVQSEWGENNIDVIFP
jgi:hypothetical protein